jgi:hypothetical protein
MRVFLAVVLMFGFGSVLQAATTGTVDATFVSAESDGCVGTDTNMATSLLTALAASQTATCTSSGGSNVEGNTDDLVWTESADLEAIFDASAQVSTAESTAAISNGDAYAANQVHDAADNDSLSTGDGENITITVTPETDQASGTYTGTYLCTCTDE